MWRCQFTNVLRLVGVCTEDDHYAMVVELMRGGSLYDRLRSGSGALSEHDRWDIAIRVAQGLADLHESGVIHRDLKSHNILLDEYGRVRIADFGLARVKTTTTTMTHTQGGSIRWSAPECFDDEPHITERSDIYSYGMILWELLTADIPFKQFSKEHIVMGKVHSGLREKIPETCHPIWREIIERCWDANPLRRPSAAEIFNRLNSTRPPMPRSIWLPAEEPQTKLTASGYLRVPGVKTDWERVLLYYQRSPVPGYDIGTVEVIWDPEKNDLFANAMKQLQRRRGNPQYVANWTDMPMADWRDAGHRELVTLSVPYTLYASEDSPDVRLLPLWHGTQEEKLRSILSAGYTAFCETDQGYFGKGVYSTPDAAYAEMYANGCRPHHQENGRLILNWVISYHSFPIVGEDYDESRHELKISVPPQYDARVIPVVQTSPGSADYRPTVPGESYQYREFMTQNGAHVLPRYVVRLVPSSGTDSQVTQMYTVLRDDLQAMETTVRMKLRDRLLTEYQGDPEWEKMRAAEKVARSTVGQRSAPQLGQGAQSLTVTTSTKQPVPKAMSRHVSIPDIAIGFEDVYLRFLNGKLIYRPDHMNNLGRKEFPIASLANPLEGTFNLSCGDPDRHLMISTGFRTRVSTFNQDRVEVWIVPQFVLQRDPRAKAFNDFLQKQEKHRNKPFAMLFNWGAWGLTQTQGVLFEGNEFATMLAAARGSNHVFRWGNVCDGGTYRQRDAAHSLVYFFTEMSECAIDSELKNKCSTMKNEQISLTQRSAPQLDQSGHSLKVTTSTEQPLPKAMSCSVPIPDIAIGFEDVYLRFLKGKLIYKPNRDNDLGRQEFPLAWLANPLEGTFDISGCGDSEKYIQISTGFRTSVNPSNKGKVEMWLVPQFVLQRDPRAKAFNDFLQKQEKHRNKPFAILFNSGGCTDLSIHAVVGEGGNEFVYILRAAYEMSCLRKAGNALLPPQFMLARAESVIAKFLYINE